MYFVPRRLPFFSPGRHDDPRRLASKTHVDMVDHGIVGVAGAHRIISALKTKSAVFALNLGHNQLGDDGCRELLHYLRSNIPTTKIRKISMNGCDLGNVSLRLIGNYIAESPHLEELSLQNNRFQADPWIAMKFAAALNHSNLRTLDLTGNTQLGDAFLVAFLLHLRAPHLRELGLSVLGLTPTVGPSLVAYLASLTSPVSFSVSAVSAARALRILRLNGNALDLTFVHDLLAALPAANFSLVHVEIHANRLNDRLDGAGGLPPSVGSSHYSPLAILSSLPTAPAAAATNPSDPPAPPQAPPPPPPPPPTWAEADRLLRALFERNRLFAAITSRQAVRLLRYARALFLRTTSTSTPESRQGYLDTGNQRCRTNTMMNMNILVLPAELHIAILHHLVPALSPAQCHRVCRYAADSTTIPKFVLPSLTAPPPPTAEEAKQRWLETVHCDVFEPSDGWEAVMRRELTL